MWCIMLLLLCMLVMLYLLVRVMWLWWDLSMGLIRDLLVLKLYSVVVLNSVILVFSVVCSMVLFCLGDGGWL